MAPFNVLVLVQIAAISLGLQQTILPPQMLLLYMDVILIAGFKKKIFMKFFSIQKLVGHTMISIN